MKYHVMLFRMARANPFLVRLARVPGSYTSRSAEHGQASFAPYYQLAQQYCPLAAPTGGG